MVQKDTRFSTVSDSLKIQKKISEVIRKVKLSPLTDKFIITDITCEKPKQKEKNCPKEIGASQRNIDIEKGKVGECVGKEHALQWGRYGQTREVKNYRRDTESLT